MNPPFDEINKKPWTEEDRINLMNKVGEILPNLIQFELSGYNIADLMKRPPDESA